MVQKQPSLNVELGEKESEGIYSNLALISHSPSEFVLDFARVLPGSPKAKIYARIVMTPPHVRLLLKALEENIKRFEDKYGEIKVYEKDRKEIGFNVPTTGGT
jgi:hypothetical protein